MNDLTIYGINVGALTISLMDINPILQTLVLIATLIFTITQIIDKLKK